MKRLPALWSHWSVHLATMVINTYITHQQGTDCNLMAIFCWEYETYESASSAELHLVVSHIIYSRFFKEGLYGVCVDKIFLMLESTPCIIFCFKTAWRIQLPNVINYRYLYMLFGKSLWPFQNLSLTMLRQDFIWWLKMFIEDPMAAVE